jgi:hypothetical protein
LGGIRNFTLNLGEQDSLEWIQDLGKKKAETWRFHRPAAQEVDTIIMKVNHEFPFADGKNKGILRVHAVTFYTTFYRVHNSLAFLLCGEEEIVSFSAAWNRPNIERLLSAIEARNIQHGFATPPGLLKEMIGHVGAARLRDFSSTIYPPAGKEGLTIEQLAQWIGIDKQRVREGARTYRTHRGLQPWDQGSRQRFRQEEVNAIVDWCALHTTAGRKMR